MGKFEEDPVWMRAARLSAELYKSLNLVNEFGFRDQITRAGLAIPSFIAQAFQDWSPKEMLDSLNYARGSTGELRSHLYIAMDIGYIDRQKGMAWVKEAKGIANMLDDMMQKILEQSAGS